MEKKEKEKEKEIKGGGVLRLSGNLGNLESPVGDFTQR